MIIEKLKKKDVKKASYLLSSVFEEMFDVFPERAISAFKFENGEHEIRRLMLMDNRIYLVAKEDREIVGIAQGYFYGGVFYMVWLVVRKELRGNGIGSRLLNELEKRIAGKCHKIYLISAVGLKASGFYERNGYSCEGLLKNAWWGVDYHSIGKVLV